MFGIWLANIVLFPVAIALMWQAVMDSPLLDLNAWRYSWGKTASKVKRIWRRSE